MRELENLVHRMLVMADGDTISEKEIQSIYDIPDPTEMMDFNSTLKNYIEETISNGCDVCSEIEKIEKKFLIEALKNAKCNIRKAADVIGLEKSTLFNKLQKHKVYYN